jgi:phage-related protein
MATDAYQMLTRSYAPESKRTPKNIILGVEVVGTSRATAEAYLDSIKAVLNRSMDGRLVLSNMPDRYWMARYQSLVGSWPAPSTFSGTLSFICHDPMAYAVAETNVVHAVDSDPKEISLTVAGSGDAEPQFILTAGEAWDSTLYITNAALGQTFQWTGSMTSGQRLTIDSRLWYVSLDGSASMTGVGGQFPKLSPGSNLRSIEGFGSLGPMKIRYKSPYAS